MFKYELQANKKGKCRVEMKMVFKHFKTNLKTFHSEVAKLLKLILAMPATNAISNRSFSVLKRIKSYLRATMTQKRLNHLVLIHVHAHRGRRNDMKLNNIANDFVCNGNRLSVFGHFRLYIAFI